MGSPINPELEMDFNILRDDAERKRKVHKAYEDRRRAQSGKPENLIYTMYTLDSMIFEYSCRFQMFRRRFNTQMYYQRRWRRRLCLVLNWISEYLDYFKLFQGAKD
jgi:hypothetical protein